MAKDNTLTRQYLVKYLSVDHGILQIMQPRVHFLGWHGLLSLQTNAELPLQSPSRPSCTSEPTSTSPNTSDISVWAGRLQNKTWFPGLWEQCWPASNLRPLLKKLAEVVQEHRPLEVLAKWRVSVGNLGLPHPSAWIGKCCLKVSNARTVLMHT